MKKRKGVEMARPKAAPSTTISVRGDKRFKMKIAILAAKRGYNIADITRSALDIAFGNELDEIDIFFVEDDAKLHQSMQEKITNKGGGAA